MARPTLSFLCGNGGNHVGIGDAFRLLDAAGVPTAAISYDNYGVVWELHRLRMLSGVPHMLAFHASVTPANPDYNKPAIPAAQEFYALNLVALPPEFDRPFYDVDPTRPAEGHVKLIIANEGDVITLERARWWGTWALETSRLCEVDDIKPALFGWSAGTPYAGFPGDPFNFWEVPEVKAWLAYASEHGHMVAVHEGGDPRYDGPGWPPLVTDPSEGITQRYHAMWEVCDAMGIKRVGVIVTEFASRYNGFPPLDIGLPQMKEAAEVYGRDGVFVATWKLFAGDSDVCNDVQPYIVPVTAHALATEYPDPDPPPEPPADTFPAHMWQVHLDNHIMDLNADAALQQAIFQDSVVPVSPEWRTEYEGVTYAGQGAESLDGSKLPRVYYTEVGNWGNVRWLNEPGVEPPVQIIDVVDQLPVHATKEYITRALAGITTITVHHSGSDSQLDGLAIVTAFANFHVNSNGWPGIGYHYVIPPNGEIYQTNRLETMSFHAGGDNDWAVGVCLAGNFTAHIPAQAQLDALAHLLPIIAAQLPAGVTVTPHRGMPGSDTVCPGAMVGEWLPAIAGVAYREEAIDPGAPPPAPPAPTIDLLSYILPNPTGMGPIFELQRFDGQGNDNGTERVQSQGVGNGYFYITRGAGGLGGKSEYEEMAYDTVNFYQRIDTSPEGDNLYYSVKDPGKDAAIRWPRYMAVGQRWIGPLHTVQFHSKLNCQPVADPRNGQNNNDVTLLARHDSMTFPSGITLQDVIEIGKVGGEVQLFSIGFGWCGWKAPWGVAYPLELHSPGSRPDNVRETLCP